MRSLLIFEQALKSEATKKAYKYQLNKFREWAKIKTFDGLLQASNKDLQMMVEDYVMYLKRTISPNSIPIYFAAIELFYVMNDKNLNFKRIRKLFPDKVKKGNERGYTHNEIKKILEASKSKRSKALVLLLASSGCRVGAIPDIKLKHISRLEGSFAIKIYEGDKEEDHIFTTPEAVKSIDEYLDERRSDGEYINNDSPMFRTSYRLGIEKVRPLTVDHIAQVMGRLVSVIERKRTGKTKRFNIPKNHGFRKFFATVVKSTISISPTMSEKLINHKGIARMDGAYFTPSIDQMFAEYKKVIPDLTIDNTVRLELENQQQKQELSKINELEEQLHDFKGIFNVIKDELGVNKNDKVTLVIGETKNGKPTFSFVPVSDED